LAPGCATCTSLKVTRAARTSPKVTRTMRINARVACATRTGPKVIRSMSSGARVTRATCAGARDAGAVRTAARLARGVPGVGIAACNAACANALRATCETVGGGWRRACFNRGGRLRPRSRFGTCAGVGNESARARGRLGGSKV
jgi:hypothetical protein